MDDITIVVGDYSAENNESFLAYLDDLSKVRGDGGFIHGGHIHYIQSRAGEFTLKAAIKGVLDKVPSIFPIDLPEIVEKNPDYEITPEMNDAFQEINEGLIMPLFGSDIIEIIRLAREYADQP